MWLIIERLCGDIMDLAKHIATGQSHGITWLQAIEVRSDDWSYSSGRGEAI